MGKHAYLIMAHHEPKALELLLRSIDDQRNDVYIHIDSKSNILHENNFENICEHSKVFFLPRRELYWAGFSTVKVILDLLRQSVSNQYDYYHLLSGVDMPLKSQEELHSFFDENQGQEFVSAATVDTWKIASRYKYYHFEKLPHFLGKNNYRFIRYVLDILQALVFIDRSHKFENGDIYFGGNWFSITHNLVLYVLSNEQKIEESYKYCFCPEEFFIQTLAMNSDFKEKISSKMNLRYVDWTRGNPYIFQNNDFDELSRKNLFFARKFSYEKHPDLMNKIYEKISF